MPNNIYRQYRSNDCGGGVWDKNDTLLVSGSVDTSAFSKKFSKAFEVNKRIAMMMKMVDFLLLGFLLTGMMIVTSKCQPNEPKCWTYLDEVVEVLGSKRPPINDSNMTDNYYNISRALYPSIHLPSLYVRVTIKFLIDYQNGIKRIDDTETMKLTWSTACTFVSVEYISLFAMSVFSLATIFPQRRETNLSVTVLPLCKNSSYARKEMKAKTWRYIVSMLEDITVNPKTSDPRINTVARVVEGHEGDEDQPIKYPKESGPKVVIWDFCWLVFVASILTSFVIGVYLYNWLKKGMEEEKGEMRILAGTVLKMTIFTFFLIITVLLLIVAIHKSFKTYAIYSGIIVGVICLSLVLSLVAACCCCCNVEECCDKNTCYRVGFLLLFPTLFMSIHHFLWVLCGIISEPYWAVPIFLIECLFGFSIMYSLYLYERDVVVDKVITEGKVWVALHLVGFVAAFTLILLIVVFVGHGHLVNVTTAGVIEVIITITLMWLIKNSGLQLRSFTSNENNQPPPESHPLTGASQPHRP